MNSDELTSIFWRILAVFVLVLLNGFFVAAEFALVKIRDTQLQPLIQRGHRRAKTARRVLKNLDRSLSAAQLGITLASLGLGWIGEPVFATILQPAMKWMNIQSEAAQHSFAFVVGFTLITFLHIVVGEQAPKWLAIQRPLPTSVWVATPLEFFTKAAYPFIWLLNQSSIWFLRQLGLEATNEGEVVHSEEELRLLFTASQKREERGALAHDIVVNALDLRRRIVRDVMRPRHEIVGLNSETPTAECLEIAEKTRFSRFPLLDHGNLDRALGVVHIKDLFSARNRIQRAGDLLRLTRKIVYVPETARLEKLLHFFLQRKLHFAFVVDEYGGTVGLVTLENVLEELVGQIQDEFDQEKPLLLKTSEGSWQIDGALPLHELGELVEEQLSEEGVSTVSGWVTHRLSGFPKVGDSLMIGNYELRVEEMDGPRVARLVVRRIVSDPATQI